MSQSNLARAESRQAAPSPTAWRALAYCLALKLGAGERGVYWSIVIAESLAGIIGIVLFRRGKWKLKQI